MKSKSAILFSAVMLAILLFSVAVPMQTAFASIGTSTIQVSPSELSIVAGGSAQANYTVALSSGTTWGTSINYKAPSGITASFSNPAGDPTFSGKMTVTVSSSVSVGTYILKLYATGDDPSGDTNVTVMVLAAAASGRSQIAVSPQSISIAQGGTGTASYTVSLVSGTAGSTNLEYQAPSGISASFSTQSGSPPFSGQLTVSVSSSLSLGSYTLTLFATGSDPSNETNVSISVSAATVIKEITLHSEKTVLVNASLGRSYTVSVTTPGSYNLTVIIPQGTFAFINESKVSQYNFTLATFNENSSFPSPSSNYAVLFFFVFEVNGMISKSIAFVNSSGDARPLITEINSPSNWTSWTFLGGELIDNGTAYNYAGGSYVFANSWSYNATSHELVNTQFISPVPWVFVEPVSKSTSSGGTSYSTTLIYVIIAVVVIILVVAGIAIGLRSSRRRKN
ncbi:MAG: hypothetical protein ACP5UZ_08300 [Thermoplasmata archaeon]